MNKKIYVGFDIDETIIHSKAITDGVPYEDCDFNIYHDNGNLAYSVYTRPNAELLLNYVDKNYNLFFYTRATKDYASKILTNLGFENPLLFHSKYIDVETVDTIYEGFKRFQIKRFDKIANKLNCNVDDMLFFDDVKNTIETRPVHIVSQVSEYLAFDDDLFSHIYNKFKSIENKNYTAKELRDVFIHANKKQYKM